MATISTTQVFTSTQHDLEYDGGVEAVSQNGQDVVYATVSNNGDGTFTETLYVLDITSGASTMLVSAPAIFDSAPESIDGTIFAADQEADPNHGIFTEGISANGQYVAYDFGDGTSAYVQNVQPGAPATEVPAPDVDGVRGEFGGASTGVSDDGLELAFGSDNASLSNPLSGVENVTTGGTSAFASSGFTGSLSPDGRYLTYQLLTGGTTPTTVIVDLINDTSVTYNFNAILSDDDQYLLYDNPNDGQVYLRGPSGSDVLVSSTAGGTPGFGTSHFIAISGDDRHVVFESTAFNLLPIGQTEGIFVKDLNTGSVTLIGAAPPDAIQDGEPVIDDPVGISYDGTRITVAGPAGVVVTQFVASSLAITSVAGDDYANAAEISSNDVVVSGTSGAIGSTVVVTVPAEAGTWTAVVLADGTWSTKIDASMLSDGSYNVHASVVDNYGFTTTTDHSFTVDRTPPQLTVTSVDGDNYINAAELAHAAVDGTVAIGDPVASDSLIGELQIKIDNGPSADFSTQFTPTNNPQSFSDDINATGFADGAHTVTVTAVDEAGNTTVETIDVIIDTTPPKIAITSISGDDVINPTELKTEQAIQGTSDAIGETVTVSLNGVAIGQAVVQADGTWLATGDFSAANSGENLVTADVDDEAGNPGEASAGVFVDRGFSAQQLSDGPSGQQGGGGGVMFPVLDAAGDKLVFTGLNFNLMSTATGSSGAQVYIKDLTTGAISFATPDPSENAEFASISPDGRYIEFVSNANLDPDDQSGTGNPPGYYLTYTEDLTTNSIYFHNLTDDRYDGTDPDTLDPGITSGYYDGDPDNSPIQPLPVFPLATADGGNSLELIDDLEPDQVVLPLVMTTQIRLDVNSLGTDGTPFFYSGGYAIPDAIPPADNDFGRFVLQEFAPQISADGSVMAFEARFFGELWDTSGYPPAITIEPPTLPEIYAGPAPPDAEQGNDPVQELASSYADGTPMPFGAIDPALSANGQFVAFWSWDNDDQPEVYVKNLATGELKVASSDALGNPGVDNASGTFNAGFNTIAISADGRYVAFTSDAILTPDDSGTTADLFIKDMQTGAITRVDLPAGTFANDLSTQLTMTADGGYIAFVTSKSLTLLDNNTVADVYGVSVAAATGTPPQISIDPVTGNDLINAAEDSTHVTVSGTSDAIGQTVTLYVDGGFLPGVIVQADGTWSTTIDTTYLTDGVHQLRATVTATDGATNTAGDLITVDTVAPTLTLSADNTPLTSDKTATVTAHFSEGIGNLAPDFLQATGGTLSGGEFTDPETWTARFTPDPDASDYSVSVAPGTLFDYAGNPNTAGASLDLSESAACYRRGTLIRTPRGDKKVERLKIGDKVMTMSGAARPIKWIGRRSYSGRFILGRKDILPICIKAGAVADNVPRRDLWISPQHAMYFEEPAGDGLLIEAKGLINGVSIVQAERIDKVEYFHIELVTHDVIIAEGALSETFIDDDSRGMFQNADEYYARYLNAAEPAAMRYCAPRLDEGYAVEAVRRRIALRAGLLRVADPPRLSRLRGYVDYIGANRIAGWAQNCEHPEAPVCLDIYAGGEMIGRTLANRCRDDLKQAGLGSGCHSFEYTAPAGLAFAPGTVEVRRSLDGVALKLAVGAQGQISVSNKKSKFQYPAATRQPRTQVHRRAAKV